MTMLQKPGLQQLDLYEDPGEKFDPSYLFGVFKRKILFFAIPTSLVIVIGLGALEIQKPLYRSEGRILVQSPEIPPDLVRPTITEVAEDRVQVIKQRILARDNLLEVMNKYSLFARERNTMSGTELLDLMRTRTDIKPLEPDAQALKRPNASAIAFTLSFDYEVPDLAMKVANEFLTQILSADATTRTNSAAEATKFLEREVQRLQSDHDAVVGQIASLEQRGSQPVVEQPGEPELTESDEARTHKKALSDLEAELARRSAVYSDEHPVIKNLKRNIAEQKRLIAAAPPPAPASSTPRTVRPSGQVSMALNEKDNVLLLVLERREEGIQKSLEDATNKLSTARLGERMERGQQGERLQVIEQPSVPTKPVWPQKLKWIAVVFALAGIAGAGSVILADAFDDSIRNSRQLGRIIDRSLIVSIPYVRASTDPKRKRRNLVLAGAAAAGVLVLAIIGVVTQTGVLDSVWSGHAPDLLSRLSRP
jgi:uncharacterized protein involved in exopolysaccharide biosynthesis